MLDSIIAICYDSSMENTCCDGTGWTGVQGAICAEHYEPCGDLLEMMRWEEEEG